MRRSSRRLPSKRVPADTFRKPGFARLFYARQRGTRPYGGTGYDVVMIATFTDFGVSSPYLGQVRAKLCELAPGVPVVDVFPDLPAFNARAAAYLLPAYSQYLPSGSVCLCVVDPGVGSDRAALAVRADDRWYVGPDNGLLTQVIRRAARVSAFAIEWRPESLSCSFHGRDLFAPVCASLANGESLPGRPVEPEALERPGWPDDLAEIVYIDNYGNAVTGLRAGQLEAGSVVAIAGTRCGYCRVFTEAPEGRAFWYANANGLVEIALPGANAQEFLDIRIGMPVDVMQSA